MTRVNVLYLGDSRQFDIALLDLERKGTVVGTEEVGRGDHFVSGVRKH